MSVDTSLIQQMFKEELEKALAQLDQKITQLFFKPLVVSPPSRFTSNGDIRLVVTEELTAKFDYDIYMTVGPVRLFETLRPKLGPGKYRITVIVERIPSPPAKEVG